MNNFDELTNNSLWRLVDVNVAHEDSEYVADVLWSLGVVAIEEFSIDNRIILRTSLGENPDDIVFSLQKQFPHVVINTVEIDRAVADTWRDFAEPTHVIDDVFLVPAWRESPPDSRSIMIEPLDTFGLGNHPTTVLALRLALSCVQPQSTVFDFGSGSGVLSVGVASLLSCSCMAYDIADSARDALTLNARRNGVNTCQWIQGFPIYTVDVVLANILAPVLIAESENIVRAVREGGVIILSGMRTEQVSDVLHHFYSKSSEIMRDELDGWTAVALQLKD